MINFYDLKAKYSSLWQSVEINPSTASIVKNVANTIYKNKNRYQKIQKHTDIPWFVIGAIHSLESSSSFKKHLHNGDSLSKRTVRVPRGRPKDPPNNGTRYTFEESAIDALNLKRGILRELGGKLDSIEKILHYCQAYNGFGYETGAGRRTTPPKRSPYLWSMTNQYQKGKYVSDGRFDENAVSQQVGVAASIKSLEENYGLDFNEGKTIPIENVTIKPQFSVIRKGDVGRLVSVLQYNLNLLADFSLSIDGVFGPITEGAVIQFQRNQNLIVDGIVGRQVWGRLAEIQNSANNA
ncbi:MAG: peptidoglycan-binding protein [Pseudobacteriovorax sp.]|nr:peptidoglycan-binding protein [Pseudobacteriovorax sp.]